VHDELSLSSAAGCLADCSRRPIIRKSVGLAAAKAVCFFRNAAKAPRSMMRPKLYDRTVVQPTTQP
jgi:hypothetical protein